MSACRERAMVLQTLKKLVAETNSECDDEATLARQTRIKARMQKKQFKCYKNQLKWEQNHMLQNRRDSRALELQVAKERTEQQGVVETKTHGEPGALAKKPTRRSERVKNAAKRAGRARHELACHELYFTQSEVADFAPSEPARTDSKECVVMVWRITAERDLTRERHARMEAREHNKQQKQRKKHLKWDAKRARQNRRDEQALLREVVTEQAAKRLVVNGTTGGGAGTAKPRRHERVKNACKKLGRAQRELRIQELC
jgi:hypothetical protein